MIGLIAAFIIAMALSVTSTPLLIRFLVMHQYGQFIRQDGQELDKGAYKAEKELTSAIKELHLTSISQKTKLIRYQVGDTIHTSIWRRHETWQNIFHQETKIEKD